LDLVERLRGLQANLDSAIVRSGRAERLEPALLDLVVDDARGLLATLPSDARPARARATEPVRRLLRGVILAIDHAEQEPPALGVETLRRARDAVRRSAERTPPGGDDGGFSP
jgi:hypothetical protein